MGDFLSHKIAAVQLLLLTNSLTDWLVAGIVAVAAWSALWIVRKFVASKFSTAQRRVPVRLIAYLIGNTRQFFLLAVALYAAQECLTLPERFDHAASDIVMLLVLLQIGIWGGRSVSFYLQIKEQERGADRVLTGSLDIISFLSRLVIWLLVIFFALDNLGVNITALVAGLGVGGVAVALSLQNVLGDLFASMSIALDKPFVIGDRLAIDTFIGNVQHIGIKTTRLLSESGEQIILSNADILKSRVRNFGRALEQRVLANIRVSYETSSDKLKGIPNLLETIVRDTPHTRFERCHLKTLGDSSLLFELSYFVQQPSVNPLLDVQQAVNFRIIEEFRRSGVEFDYSTQRVILAQPPAAADQ